MRTLVLVSALSVLALSAPVYATQAYGSLNNFDVVNDTEQECHGFEIELEDVHSLDITYTYDWNHYGAPNIREDNSDPLHPRVFVRYEAKKNSDGSWSAYTAVPAGPVAPTDGHQFIDPSVNFGGEHFGVGFYGVPTAVHYFWLLDDGAGNLYRGNPVDIATPAFAYVPAAGGNPAQVNAVIEAPEPPEIPVLEFGEASWVKVTRTETHNEHPVELRDLVSDDPEDPDDRNWRNGEPDEVEVEWQIMQTEFNQDNGGKNGELENGAQELPDGDEIITLRYDFFKYVGPLDPESGEALAEDVGPDGIHGEGIIDGEEGGTIDLSTVVVVGDYIGAQMAGFDAEGKIGLIDNLQDGEVFAPYVDRRVVIAGVPPIVTETSGDLPDGMTFDEVSGVISGTPTVAGVFFFSVHSTDANAGDVSKTYDLKISDGFEGAVEGVLEGSPEGILEGTLEGVVEGAVEGTPEGVVEGVVEGTPEGTVEGAIEGTPEGVVEGVVEGTPEGTVEGVIEGTPEGVVEGIIEGTPEGTVEGVVEGTPEGTLEGSVEGIVEGTPEGTLEGSVEGVVEGTPDGTIEGSLEGTPEGVVEGSVEGVVEGTPEGGVEGVIEGTPEGVVEGSTEGSDTGVHATDQDGDSKISLSELLRAIQFFNSNGFHCDVTGEDGYAPGSGDQSCAPYDADYNTQDWVINLSELLRLIQFFNSGGYHYCPLEASEDGYCAGLA